MTSQLLIERQETTRDKGEGIAGCGSKIVQEHKRPVAVYLIPSIITIRPTHTGQQSLYEQVYLSGIALKQLLSLFVCKNKTDPIILGPHSTQLASGLAECLTVTPLTIHILLSKNMTNRSRDYA
ncbi:hypothetical protein E2C01_011846 [Portunus trituberculatus]|uniref:Uncharacterized protein n=1 Tax=Portunus trituberculatus TaxID=210409 RepID=A0A5B7DCK4_PORTR|nr:hypothetical protein [Portunus trituberculatus]